MKILNTIAILYVGYYLGKRAAASSADVQKLIDISNAATDQLKQAGLIPS